ncbi:MAG TPA: hypothetical protein VFA07_03225 [Chthonomonadaceae bacterium]|nr:hypothetical protein [Chthonomonadaceae bacterium]
MAPVGTAYLRRGFLSTVLAIAAFAGALGAARADAPQAATPPAPTARPPGKVTIQKFQHLQWSLEGNYVRSQGNVQAIYADPTTNETTTVTAQNLDYDLNAGLVSANGNVRAVYTSPKEKEPTVLTGQNVTYDTNTGLVNAGGGVRIERTDQGYFTGQELQFNLKTRTGYVTHAALISDVARLSGERIEALPDGSYTLTNGSFTTCVLAHPDYHITAHEIRYIPGQSVSARGIGFYLGPTRVITLPSYRRSLHAGSSVPLPVPSYNSAEGFTLRFTNTPIAEPHKTLDYDLRFGTRHILDGYLAFQMDVTPTAPGALPPHGVIRTLNDPLRGFLEQLTPPTYREYTESSFAEDYARRASLYAVLQNNMGIYNRRRNDLLVSRYPEIGVHFANLLGHGPVPTPDSAQQEGVPPVGSVEAVAQRIPNAPFLLDVYASGAELREEPSRVTAGRLSLRINAATQPLLLGRRLSLRAGLSNWLNAYSTGTAYNLFAPEVALNYLPTRTSLISVGYRYLTDTGNTPFLFDRRDIRHELRLQYQVGGPWAFGLLGRWDLERGRAYDAEVSILRNFDCMQIGISYRVRTQSIGVVFTLLPPTANRARRRALMQEQQNQLPPTQQPSPPSSP